MTTWDGNELRALAHELRKLREDLLILEASAGETAARFHESFERSARNLLHYVALRQHDVRGLQDQLASLGLSSLGRAESCVLATLDSVLDILHTLGREPVRNGHHERAPSFSEGAALLKAHTEALLGTPSSERGVHIMVTMSGEAADNYPLVRELVGAGMNCARINCAHDDTTRWGRMIDNLRRAERELGRRCRILMDLGGPKLRTGELQPGPRVLKWKPRRDCSGHVLAPARVWLGPLGSVPPGNADATHIPVPATWLKRLGPGVHVDFHDARGSARELLITEATGAGWWAECRQTAYVASGTVLHIRRKKKKHPAAADETRVGAIAEIAVPIVLRKGDTLLLTRDATPGTPAEKDSEGRRVRPARIPCSLPEVFHDVRPGERVWFDDGKIGGVIQRVHADVVEVKIVRAAERGTELGADKGINFPDSDLQLPALTAEDLDDLDFVAKHADLVGLSFVHAPEDVLELQKQLSLRGTSDRGIVLKIETRRGFEQLPHLLLAAMRSPCVGVMIARGDLAVECGYERLAELQEEILWICEAAHVPVIWATQVLESLAKQGMPSRAEITDAAMGERAECVMLNKGPHIVQAVQVLDDILKRMQGHQNKKRSMLRPLKLAGAFPTSQNGTKTKHAVPT
jgi:pyruvate kinase